MTTEPGKKDWGLLRQQVTSCDMYVILSLGHVATTSRLMWQDPLLLAKYFHVDREGMF